MQRKFVVIHGAVIVCLVTMFGVYFIYTNAEPKAASETPDQKARRVLEEHISYFIEGMQQDQEMERKLVGSVKYNLEKSNSLVSPYVASARFELLDEERSGMFDLPSITLNEVSFAFQNDHWQVTVWRIKAAPTSDGKTPWLALGGGWDQLGWKTHDDDVLDVMRRAFGIDGDIGND